MVPSSLLFLSTLPARGATNSQPGHGHSNRFLSTLPARGATMYDYGNNTAQFLFLSTLPARGATVLQE